MTTLPEQKLPEDTLNKQVERLAQYILENIPGEPSQSEGAIDTAIRLLRTRQEALSEERARIREKVEGMKNPEITRTTLEQELIINASYNRAIDDILEALEEQKEKQ